jgi:hypothetical protein
LLICNIRQPLVVTIGAISIARHLVVIIDMNSFAGLVGR